MPRDMPSPPAHQRAQGRAELVVAAGPGGARLRHLFQPAPLRVLFPTPSRASRRSARCVNCAGGLAGGDALELSLGLEAGARVTVDHAGGGEGLSQPRPGDARSHAASCWPPAPPGMDAAGDHPVRRRAAAPAAALELAAGARLLAAEMLVFGRAARGERCRGGRAARRWRLRRGGRCSGPMRCALDDPRRAPAAPFGFGGAEALATLLLAAPDAAAAARPARATCPSGGGAACVPRPACCWRAGSARPRRCARRSGGASARCAPPRSACRRGCRGCGRHEAACAMFAADKRAAA